MATEIKLNLPSGNTTYAIVFDSSLQAWNTSGSAFEAWADGNITDYDIALTYVGGGFYKGDFPSAIAAGRYTIATYLQLGGTPAITDTPLVSEPIIWDGTNETFLAEIGLSRMR